MKKILAAILGALGVTTVNSEAAPSREVNVPAESIQFSMPTISMDSIKLNAPTASSFEGAPQFHEDNWAQLEFFPMDRLAEVQKLLKELKSFEAENRTQSGWKKIYRREIIRTAIALTPVDLGTELNARTLPAPILTTSSQPLGQVEHGFSLEFGKNAYIYGLQEDGRITVIGVSLQGADDMLLADAFSKLNQRYRLILVDWQQQFVLTGVSNSGQFELWRP